MDYAGWLKEFLDEWEKASGYKLECDELTEEHLMADYYLRGISPSQAVPLEMEEG